MDLQGPIRRTVDREWQRDGEMSGRSCAARRAGPTAALDELFRLHWRRAHQAAYLVVHDAAAAEDIAQEASSPRSATSTASIAAGRSLRGCTASSSTGRSTTPAPGRCGPRPTSAGARSPGSRTRRPGGVAARRDRPAAPGSARRGRPSLPARVHAGRDRDDAERPARDGQLTAAARPRRDAGGGS